MELALCLTHVRQYIFLMNLENVTSMYRTFGGVRRSRLNYFSH